jgi:hypothetical protein
MVIHNAGELNRSNDQRAPTLGWNLDLIFRCSCLEDAPYLDKCQYHLR